MANPIQVRRGALADLPATANDGEPLWVNDSPNWSFYMGRGALFPPFLVSAGGGTVTEFGTPVDNQIAVWVSGTSIEGTTSLTFDSASGALQIGAGGSTASVEIGGDDVTLYLGQVTNNQSTWIGSSTNVESKLGLGSLYGRHLVLTDETNISKDHDHALQTNPTLFVHSATDPDTDNTEWISLYHTATTGFIESPNDITIDTGGSQYTFDTSGTLTIDTELASPNVNINSVTTGVAKLKVNEGSSSWQNMYVFGTTNRMNVGFGLYDAESSDNVRSVDTSHNFAFAFESSAVSAFASEMYVLNTNVDAAGGADAAKILTLKGDGTLHTQGNYVFGEPSDINAEIEVDTTFNQLLYGVSADAGRQFVLTDSSNIGKDHDHATPTDPTLFIHSATDPDTNNSQYISLFHDQSNAFMTSGTGRIEIQPGNGQFEVASGGSTLIRIDAGTAGTLIIDSKSSNQSRVDFRRSGDRWSLGNNTSDEFFILSAATATNCLLIDGSSHLSTFAGAVLAQMEVEANTATSGTPNVLTDSESRKVLTNEGATAENHHDLPTATAGIQYTFYIQDSDGMQINAASGDTIRIGGSVSAAAGNIATTTVGEAITLVAINTTEWVAINVIDSTNWTVT